MMGASKTKTKKATTKRNEHHGAVDSDMPETPGATYVKRTWTEEEVRDEVNAMYSEIITRRDALNLATQQVLSEMQYAGSPNVTFETYTQRADAIMAWLKDGSASVDGA